MTRPRNMLIAVLGTGALALAGLAGPGAAQIPPPEEALTVDDAVRIALTQNNAYLQAVAGVGVAEGGRLNSLAGILPRASGSYAYSDNSSTTTLKGLDTVTITTFDDLGNIIDEEVVATGDVPLDSRAMSDSWSASVRTEFSLSRWYSYRGAQASVQSARWNRESAAQQLAFDVRQQFYLVLRAQDLLTVQEEDLRLARDEERRTNSMFELGSVARVDVLKARVRVSDAELALIRQRNAVEIEKSRLATLLGFRADTRLQLSGQLTPEVAPIDSVTAAEDALDRPDLQRAREDLRSASNVYKSAAWSRLPGLFAEFSWNGSVGSSVSDNLTQERMAGPDSNQVTSTLVPFETDSDRETDGWSVRVGASVSLDAFVNMGEHKRTRKIREQAEYALEGQELAVQQELEEAILNYRASVQAIEAAERGVESAEEDLRLSQERYQQGLGTILELLEAQVALTRARNNEVNALTGLKISEAALDKARGAPLPYVPSD